jgi:hypothetical protein
MNFKQLHQLFSNAEFGIKENHHPLLNEISRIDTGA